MSNYHKYHQIVIVPACSSRSPCRSEDNRALVSAVAACAVGVDPTESTKRGWFDKSCPAFAKKSKASFAAKFTASTSEERKEEASDGEVDAYAFPAWQ